MPDTKLSVLIVWSEREKGHLPASYSEKILNI